MNVHEAYMRQGDFLPVSSSYANGLVTGLHGRGCLSPAINAAGRRFSELLQDPVAASID